MEMLPYQSGDISSQLTAAPPGRSSITDPIHGPSVSTPSRYTTAGSDLLMNSTPVVQSRYSPPKINSSFVSSLSSPDVLLRMKGTGALALAARNAASARVQPQTSPTGNNKWGDAEGLGLSGGEWRPPASTNQPAHPLLSPSGAAQPLQPFDPSSSYASYSNTSRPPVGTSVDASPSRRYAPLGGTNPGYTHRCSIGDDTKSPSAIGALERALHAIAASAALSSVGAAPVDGAAFGRRGTTAALGGLGAAGTGGRAAATAAAASGAMEYASKEAWGLVAAMTSGTAGHPQGQMYSSPHRGGAGGGRVSVSVSPRGPATSAASGGIGRFDSAHGRDDTQSRDALLRQHGLIPPSAVEGLLSKYGAGSGTFAPTTGTTSGAGLEHGTAASAAAGSAAGGAHRPLRLQSRSDDFSALTSKPLFTPPSKYSTSGPGGGESSGGAVVGSGVSPPVTPYHATPARGSDAMDGVRDLAAKYLSGAYPLYTGAAGDGVPYTAAAAGGGDRSTPTNITSGTPTRDYGSTAARADGLHPHVSSYLRDGNRRPPLDPAAVTTASPMGTDHTATLAAAPAGRGGAALPSGASGGALLSSLGASGAGQLHSSIGMLSDVASPPPVGPLGVIPRAAPAANGRAGVAVPAPGAGAGDGAASPVGGTASPRVAGLGRIAAAGTSGGAGGASATPSLSAGAGDTRGALSATPTRTDDPWAAVLAPSPQAHVHANGMVGASVGIHTHPHAAFHGLGLPIGADDASASGHAARPSPGGHRDSSGQIPYAACGPEASAREACDALAVSAAFTQAGAARAGAAGAPHLPQPTPGFAGGVWDYDRARADVTPRDARSSAHRGDGSLGSASASRADVGGVFSATPPSLCTTGAQPASVAAAAWKDYANPSSRSAVQRDDAPPHSPPHRQPPNTAHTPPAGLRDRGSASYTTASNVGNNVVVSPPSPASLWASPPEHRRVSATSLSPAVVGAARAGGPAPLPADAWANTAATAGGTVPATTAAPTSVQKATPSQRSSAADAWSALGYTAAGDAIGERRGEPTGTGIGGGQRGDEPSRGLHQGHDVRHVHEREEGTIPPSDLWAGVRGGRDEDGGRVVAAGTFVDPNDGASTTGLRGGDRGLAHHPNHSDSDGDAFRAQYGGGVHYRDHDSQGMSAAAEGRPAAPRGHALRHTRRLASDGSGTSHRSERIGATTMTAVGASPSPPRDSGGSSSSRGAPAEHRHRGSYAGNDEQDTGRYREARKDRDRNSDADDGADAGRRRTPPRPRGGRDGYRRATSDDEYDEPRRPTDGIRGRERKGVEDGESGDDSQPLRERHHGSRRAKDEYGGIQYRGAAAERGPPTRPPRGGGRVAEWDPPRDARDDGSARGSARGSTKDSTHGRDGDGFGSGIKGNALYDQGGDRGGSRGDFFAALAAAASARRGGPAARDDNSGRGGERHEYHDNGNRKFKEGATRAARGDHRDARPHGRRPRSSHSDSSANRSDPGRERGGDRWDDEYDRDGRDGLRLRDNRDRARARGRENEGVRDHRHQGEGDEDNRHGHDSGYGDRRREGRAARATDHEDSHRDDGRGTPWRPDRSGRSDGHRNGRPRYGGGHRERTRGGDGRTPRGEGDSGRWSEDDRYDGHDLFDGRVTEGAHGVLRDERGERYRSGNDRQESRGAKARRRERSADARDVWEASDRDARWSSRDARAGPTARPYETDDRRYRGDRVPHPPRYPEDDYDRDEDASPTTLLLGAARARAARVARDAADDETSLLLPRSVHSTKSHGTPSHMRASIRGTPASAPRGRSAVTSPTTRRGDRSAPADDASPAAHAARAALAGLASPATPRGGRDRSGMGTPHRGGWGSDDDYDGPRRRATGSGRPSDAPAGHVLHSARGRDGVGARGGQRNGAVSTRGGDIRDAFASDDGTPPPSGARGRHGRLDAPGGDHDSYGLASPRSALSNSTVGAFGDTRRGSDATSFGPTSRRSSNAGLGVATYDAFPTQRVRAGRAQQTVVDAPPASPPHPRAGVRQGRPLGLPAGNGAGHHESAHPNAHAAFAAGPHPGAGPSSTGRRLSGATTPRTGRPTTPRGGYDGASGGHAGVGPPSPRAHTPSQGVARARSGASLAHALSPAVAAGQARKTGGPTRTMSGGRTGADRGGPSIGSVAAAAAGNARAVGTPLSANLRARTGAPMDAHDALASPTPRVPVFGVVNGAGAARRSASGGVETRSTGPTSPVARQRAAQHHQDSQQHAQQQQLRSHRAMHMVRALAMRTAVTSPANRSIPTATQHDGAYAHSVSQSQSRSRRGGYDPDNDDRDRGSAAWPDHSVSRREGVAEGGARGRYGSRTRDHHASRDASWEPPGGAAHWGTGARPRSSTGAYDDGDRRDASRDSYDDRRKAGRDTRGGEEGRRRYDRGDHDGFGGARRGHDVGSHAGTSRDHHERERGTARPSRRTSVRDGELGTSSSQVSVPSSSALSPSTGRSPSHSPVTESPWALSSPTPGAARTAHSHASSRPRHHAAPHTSDKRAATAASDVAVGRSAASRGGPPKGATATGTYAGHASGTPMNMGELGRSLGGAGRGPRDPSSPSRSARFADSDADQHRNAAADRRDARDGRGGYGAPGTRQGGREDRDISRDGDARSMLSGDSRRSGRTARGSRSPEIRRADGSRRHADGRWGAGGDGDILSGDEQSEATSPRGPSQSQSRAAATVVTTQASAQGDYETTSHASDASSRVGDVYSGYGTHAAPRERGHVYGHSDGGERVRRETAARDRDADRLLERYRQADRAGARNRRDGDDSDDDNDDGSAPDRNNGRSGRRGGQQKGQGGGGGAGDDDHRGSRATHDEDEEDADPEAMARRLALGASAKAHAANLHALLEREAAAVAARKANLREMDAMEAAAEDIRLMRMTVDGARAKEARTRKIADDRLEALREMQVHTGELVEYISRYRDAARAATERAEEADEEARVARQALDAAQREVAQLREEADALTSDRVASIEAAVAGHVAEKEELEKQTAKATALSHTLQKAMEEKDSALARAMALVSSQAARHAEANDVFKGIAADTSETQTKLAEALAMLQHERTVVRQLQGSLAVTQAEQVDARASAEVLERELMSASERYKVLQEEIAARDSRIAKLQAEVSRIPQTMAEVRDAERAAVRSDLDELSRLRADAQPREAELQRVSAALAVLTASAAGEREERVRVEAALHDAHRDVSTLTGARDNLSATVERLQRDLSDARGDPLALERCVDRSLSARTLGRDDVFTRICRCPCACPGAGRRVLDHGEDAGALSVESARPSNARGGAGTVGADGEVVLRGNEVTALRAHVAALQRAAESADELRELLADSDEARERAERDVERLQALVKLQTDAITAHEDTLLQLQDRHETDVSALMHEVVMMRHARAQQAQAHQQQRQRQSDGKAPRRGSMDSTARRSDVGGRSRAALDDDRGCDPHADRQPQVDDPSLDVSGLAGGTGGGGDVGAAEVQRPVSDRRDSGSWASPQVHGGQGGQASSQSQLEAFRFGDAPAASQSHADAYDVPGCGPAGVVSPPQYFGLRPVGAPMGLHDLASPMSAPIDPRARQLLSPRWGGDTWDTFAGGDRGGIGRVFVPRTDHYTPAAASPDRVRGVEIATQKTVAAIASLVAAATGTGAQHDAHHDGRGYADEYHDDDAAWEAEPAAGAGDEGFPGRPPNSWSKAFKGDADRLFGREESVRTGANDGFTDGSPATLDGPSPASTGAAASPIPEVDRPRTGSMMKLSQPTPLTLGKGPGGDTDGDSAGNLAAVERRGSVASRLSMRSVPVTGQWGSD